MAEPAYHVRCQRCGDEMDLRDPAPGAAWQPQQFWVCPRCQRHFWTTYPAAAPPATAPAPAGAAAATPPAATAAQG